ncbi:MAG: restriction endonuclease [Nitrospirota bacterium]
MSDTILDRWDITAEELTQVIDQNPSLRGMILGYLAELKLEKLWLSGEEITEVRKGDDHDRKRKGDRVIRYKGQKFIFESKSLQTGMIRQTDKGWVGKAQVDASDRRDVILPDGSKVTTTCLLKGEFDILAVNVFAFENKWRFVFAKNSDLPTSNYEKYTEYQRKHSFPLES